MHDWLMLIKKVPKFRRST